ncbi:hypothetical protein [Candidatus Enterococcus mansonii]|uniref:Uncharacterized protein n=1 Tax=Candidatus Enterococcus mansonii TaxID=1834181 RepID=A0A242CH52_9ENTE|nr:hypothetical protein [Enterococcus sp. 4G2_DIV0659]OTO09573.1 hypothetical protein A5880_000252 [Enterococcus sp. 4G2_DIV0659]
MIDISNKYVTIEQHDKAIQKQLKVIKKLQKRVKTEQRQKNQLASQLKRSYNQVNNQNSGKLSEGEKR